MLKVSNISSQIKTVIQNKELSSVFIYSLASLSQGLISLLLLPIVIRELSINEFGVYSLIHLTGMFFGSFFYFGSSSSLSRFYFASEIKDLRNRAIIASSTISIFGALIVILFGIFASSLISNILFDSNLYVHVILIAMISTASGIVVTYILTLYRCKKQPILYSLFSLLSLLLTLPLALWLYNVKLFPPISVPFISILGSNLVVILLSMSSLNFSLKGEYWKKSELINHFKYGLPIAFTSLLLFTSSSIDKFLISEYLDMESLAIYYLGFRLASIIQTVYITPFSLYWSIQKFEYALSRQNTLDSTIFRVYMFLGLLVIIVILLCSHSILELFTEKVAFKSTLQMILPVSLGLLMRGLTNIFDLGLLLSKKTMVLSMINVFYLLMSTILLIICVKYFEIEGAYWSFLLSGFFLVSPLVYYSNRERPIEIKVSELFEVVIYMLILVYLDWKIGIASFLPGLKLILLSLAILHILFHVRKDFKLYAND